MQLHTAYAFALVLALSGCAGSSASEPAADGADDAQVDDTTGSPTTGPSTGDESDGGMDTSSDAQDDTDSLAEQPDISGRWVSPCLPDGDGGGILLDFDIDAVSWDLAYQVFGDDGCTFPVLTVRIAGPYALEHPSENVEGAWEGRFGFDHKEVTPHFEGVLGFLESEAGCNFDGFVVGEATDIYVMGCPGLGQRPQAACTADYDLVALDDGGLRFGARPADNDMCTPQKRPSELSPLVLTPSEGGQ